MNKEQWIELINHVERALDMEREAGIAYLENVYLEEPTWLEQALGLFATSGNPTVFMERPASDSFPELLDRLQIDGGEIQRDAKGPLSRYKVLKPLGEGGMGAVYLVSQEEPVKRELALKVIKMGFDCRETRARFAAEYQALAYLDHPHVAQFFESGFTPEGRPFFTMEYVSGQPLTEYCRAHRLSLSQKLALFCKVCEGVQHAHQKGIIHRDLKPSNILVQTRDGHALPKLIDFGIAKSVGKNPIGGQTLFTRDMVLGTPTYMSPEQADQSERHIDTRTDVYALGAIFYELLTGTPPFDPARLKRASLSERLSIIRREQPPPPSQRLRQRSPSEDWKALRGDLDNIALKALSKEKAQRYDSPEDLARDIRRYQDRRPVLASPPGLLYQSRKFVQRHRTGVTAAAMVLLAMLSAGITTLQSWIRAEKALNESTLLNQLIVDTLATADPRTGLEPTVTEALERARMNMERPDLTPEIRAALGHVIGMVFTGLGHYPRAAAILEPVLHSRISILGKAHEKTQGTRIELASAYYHLERFPEAEDLFQYVVDHFRPHSSSAYLRAKRGLALTWKEVGKQDEAITLLEAVLGEYLAFYGERHIETTSTMVYLANELSKKKRYAEAEPLFRDALALQIDLLGEDHPKVAETQNNYSLLLMNMGRYGDARTEILSAISTMEKYLGPSHKRTLLGYYNLARNYYLEGNLEESEPLTHYLLNERIDTLGEDHTHVRSSWIFLAQNRLAVGETADAERIFRRLICDLDGDPAKEDQYVSLCSNLAVCLNRQGRYAEAFEILAPKLSGKPAKPVLHQYFNLAIALLGMERYSEARPLLKEIVEIDPTTHHQALYGFCLAAMGKCQAAEAQFLGTYLALHRSGVSFEQWFPEENFKAIEPCEGN